MSSKLRYQCAECGAPIAMIPSRDATIPEALLRSCDHLNAAIAAMMSATATGESKVAA